MKYNKKKLSKTFAAVTCASIAATVSSCGSSSDTASTAATLSATIATLAVASPTANRSSTSFQLHGEKKNFFAKIHDQLIQKNWMSFFLPYSLADLPPDTAVKPMDTMLSEVKANLTADPATVAGNIGSLTATSYQASCYGPGWTDDATGQSVNRPVKDLGMVSANASNTDTTACSAAQLNALIGGAPAFANKMITLQSTLVAAENKKGTALPAVGASIDATADIPSAVKEKSGITITSATITRMNDRTDGNPVYKTLFAFTDAKSQTGSVTIYHTPTNADNTNFTGLLQAVIPENSLYRGVSMVYKQQDGVLTYALDTAYNQGTSSKDFFNSTSGRIDYTKAAFGQDGNRIIASFNSKTNASAMHYAWQAGKNDGATRAFAINIAAGTLGAQTGVAYYGFGAAISSLTDDVSTPWASKMYCNWLNGLANGSTVSEVQGQTIKQSGGKFIADTSKINFAPTDTCNKSGTFTVSNSLPSDYNGSRSGTKDLTTIGALGSVASVTVPTYNIPAN